MNILDKVIGYVNPEAGAKRAYYREAMTFAEPGSNAGSMSRPAFKLWQPAARTADADTLINLDLIRSRSRDLIRNNPVAKGVIDTIVSGVLGGGLRMISSVNSASLGLSADEVLKIDEKIEAEFGLWAENPNCDIERSLDFYGLQAMFLTQALEAGDVFSILTSRDNGGPYDFALNILEADQCVTPLKYLFSSSCRGGVRKDAYGAPLSYFFTENVRRADNNSPFLFRETYNNILLRNDLKEIPAWHKDGFRQVIHFFEKTRPGQSRGVPLLAPVMEQMKQLERYAGAELMAAVIAGMFTVFIHDDDMERMSGFGKAPSFVGGKDKDVPPDLALGAGAVVQLSGSKKIETVNPSRPNAQFSPFYEAIIKQISMGIGLPYEVVTKHFAASYSASQGALLEAWRFFRNKREHFVRYFCRPVYERFFIEAVRNGRINAPGFETDPLIRKAWLSCEWIGPAKGMIDEVKEVKAAALRVSLGISTLKIEAIRLMGQDWHKILPEIIRETELIKKHGLHIGNVDLKEVLESEPAADDD